MGWINPSRALRLVGTFESYSATVEYGQFL